MRAIARTTVFYSLVVLFIAGGQVARAQQPGATAKGSELTATSSMTQAQIDAIISAFSSKETRFRNALNEYAFKRDAMIQEIGMGGQVVGEYHRVSNFTFDDRGGRFEKIGYFPMSTLQGISVTPEDLEDLGGVNPFALEAAKINLYNFKYVGKERIDELDLFVFDVTPRVMPKHTLDRFFVGRIWVDDHDLQIVKSKGKAGPETKQNKFPIVETYREQIDGKYWFPTYVYADDDLIFDNGTDVRIRMKVRYTEYKKGHATVIIKEVDDTKPQPQDPGQPGSEPAGQPPVEGGILNGRAIELPLPVYPEAARKVKASGEVQVRVLIDENGKVIVATPVSGPETLQQAALDAVRKARFRPYMLNGVAMKISGIIVYRFAAP